MDNVIPFADKCIVNQNDIYLYFEIIRQLKPESIIDIGMFLKRIGAVSRQAMNLEIDPDVELCGVDVMPDCSVDVYGVVYDKIWSVGEFQMWNLQDSDEEKESDKTYDIAFMLRTDMCLCASEERSIVGKIAKKASYLVTDDACYERNKGLLAFKSYRELQLDNDRYKLVILK